MIDYTISTNMKNAIQIELLIVLREKDLKATEEQIEQMMAGLLYAFQESFSISLDTAIGDTELESVVEGHAVEQLEETNTKEYRVVHLSADGSSVHEKEVEGHDMTSVVQSFEDENLEVVRCEYI